MAKALISALFKLLMQLVTIVLTPLDLAIKALIPDLTNVFGAINGFFDYISNIGAYAVSYLGFTSTVISILVLEITLIITIPLAVHIVKLALKWYRTLMP